MSIPNSHQQPAGGQPISNHNPSWEEGESENGSQDAEGEIDLEEGSIRFSVEEAGSGESDGELPSPYLNRQRPPPRITLRVNQRAESSGKDVRKESASPEMMDLDLPAEPTSASHGGSNTAASARVVSGPMDTPPASPLRAFIAPPAQIASAATAHPARPASPRRPSSSTPARHPAASSSAPANYGPSRSSASSAPHQAVGSLWKTSVSAASKAARAETQEEDIEMGDEEQEEGEDELEDDTASEYDDRAESKRAAASAARPKGSAGSGASTSTAGAKGKAKRPTRGPGKKQKAKAKDKEKENAKVEDTAPRGREEGQAEAGSKSEFAYEYVAVSQRKEGRQHIKYEMSMRQQPLQARMCNAGEKADRRPIDPPPIIQLKVIDADDDDPSEKSRQGKKAKRDTGGMSFMHNPYYFLYATLVGSDEAQTELHVTDDGKTRFLTGTPVSSLYYLKDMNHRDAAFFVFPDLGVRKEGQYKLKLTLFEIVDQEVFYCATSYTDTFTVLSAKKFPGMQRATDLSRSFADQGLKIRVRKETKKRSSGFPPRNKRRSSITEEEIYNPKRPRPSLDPNYGGAHFSYDPAYPHAQVHNMPPPPVPHLPPRPIVHPPPHHEVQQQQWAQSSASLPPRRSADHGGSTPYGEPPTPQRQDVQLPGRRSEGPAFQGHPGREHNLTPVPPPSASEMARRDAAYFHDERERQRHLDIQQSQRREIDARRQAEVAKVTADAERSHQLQQNRQHVQQQQRLAQLARDQATFDAQRAGSPHYPPGYGDRGSYTPGSSVGHLPDLNAGQAASAFEEHEREKRRVSKAKKQERTSRGEYGPGMPRAEGGYPAVYGPDGRAYHAEQYQHQDRGQAYQHPHQPLHPQFPQYPPPPPNGSAYREPGPPPQVYWDQRDRQPSHDGRRVSRTADSVNGRADPYSSANGPDQRPSSHPIYASHHPTHSSAHTSSVPSFDSHPSRSASTTASARSTPQPVRTPQDNTVSLPSRSIPSGKPTSANHYEPPSSRSSLARVRTDEWESSPRSLSFGSADGDRDVDRGRETLTLPSISNLTTPGHSGHSTPVTPATAITPGRDHRMGLGHLVD